MLMLQIQGNRAEAVRASVAHGVEIHTHSSDIDDDGNWSTLAWASPYEWHGIRAWQSATGDQDATPLPGTILAYTHCPPQSPEGVALLKDWGISYEAP